MNCEVCGSPIIIPSGNPNANILIIDEFPTEEDMAVGRAYAGEYSYILRSEFAKAGFDLLQCRITTLWLHAPEKEGSGKRADHSHSMWHKEQALKECMDRTAILCLGTDVTQFFLGYNSTEISGIPMTSPITSAPLVMGTRSTQDVIGGTNGEYALGIRKFIQEYKKQLVKEMTQNA